MSLRIIAVGKKHEAWVSDGIERYQKRLKRPYVVEWVYMSHSSRDQLEARRDESERILARLDPREFVILLDERGVMLPSPAFSAALLGPLQSAQSVTMIIGGAYGVDHSVHSRANLVWSLSLLVFPHQLVRLLLMEQLYRAQEIASGGPYHHE